MVMASSEQHEQGDTHANQSTDRSLIHASMEIEIDTLYTPGIRLERGRLAQKELRSRLVGCVHGESRGSAA